MVEQIEIINHQGHEHTLLDLSSGLNIIKGRSHSGKSSMMRNIRWILENKPRGDKFRRDFMSDDDSVIGSMSFREGTWVSREKCPKKKINCYRSSEIDEPLVALRTDVPDEIKEITKMSSVNTQTQDEKYFLLGKTPGQVASELNKVVGLQIIDDKKFLAKKKVSEFSGRLKVLGAQILETQEELELPHFTTIHDLEALVAKIENSLEVYKKRDGEIAAVSAIIANIISEERRVEEADEIISISDQLMPIKAKIELHNKKEAEIIRVIDALAYIESWQAELESIESILAIESDLKMIKGKIVIASALRSNILKVATLYRSIERAELSIAEAVKAIASYGSLKRVLEERRTKAEEALNYCNKCGADRKYWSSDRLNDTG